MNFDTIRSHKDGVVWVLGLAGQLDAEARDSVVRESRKALASGASAPHAEVSRVSFIDSSSVSAPLGLRRFAQAADCELRVTDPSQRVSRLLTVTGRSSF